MNLQDFSEIAALSAKKYLAYLQDNEKGKIEIPVIKIEPVERYKFKLYITQKTPNVDSLELKSRSSRYMENQDFSSAKILEYNEKQLWVMILANSETAAILRNISPEDLVFESDMKFLVKAIQKWYENYSGRLCIPPEPRGDSVRLKCPEASAEQLDAIRMCLSSAVSYIWGAPGTGKTKMVLSNAVYEYAKDDKKTLIMAPTNNALEQSLRGVIQVLKQKHIPTEKIIRLGRATTEFLAEYPEVCEARFYEKMLDECFSELSGLREKLEHQEHYIQVLGAWEDTKQLLQQYEIVNNQLAQIQECADTIQQDIDKAEAERELGNQGLQEIYKRIKCVRQRIVKRNRNRFLLEQYGRITAILSQYHTDMQKLTEKLQKIEKDCNDTKEKITGCSNKIRSEERVYDELLKKKHRPKNRLRFLIFPQERVAFEKLISENKDALTGLSKQKAESEYVLETLQQRMAEIKAQMTSEKIMLDHSDVVKQISVHCFLEKLSLPQLTDRFERELTVYEESENDDSLEIKLRELEVSQQQEEKVHQELIKYLDIKRSVLHTQNKQIDLQLQKRNEIEETALKISEDVFAKENTLEELKNAFDVFISENQSFVIDRDLSQKLAEKAAEYDNILQHMEIKVGKRTVIACTVDYAVIHYEQLLSGFAEGVKHLFVDEAAYCPLVKSGVFCSFGIPVTLFGDHMQLPPVCEMRKKDIVSSVNMQECFLWDISAVYFSHLITSGKDIDDIYRDYIFNKDPDQTNIKVSFLKKTYRFNGELAAVLDRYIYHQGFCGNDNAITRIEVLDAPHFGKVGSSRESKEEIDAISQYLKAAHPENFVILTPYRDQRKRIRKELHLSDDNVLTVHASQGREWDTVIISVVDAKRKFFMSSLCDASNGMKVVNTAVSRCRKHLLLVMDCSEWERREDELLSAIASIGQKI